MWGLVGNPEDRFSRDAAHYYPRHMKTLKLFVLNILLEKDAFFTMFTDLFLENVILGL